MEWIEDNIIWAALVGLIALMVPYVLFLITCQRLLEQVSPENRRMPPGNVWLMLIPVFNMVYNFIMNARMSDSIRAEILAREWQLPVERPTYWLGLSKAILLILTRFPGAGGTLFTLGWIGVGIVYWVMLHHWLKQFQGLVDSSEVLDSGRYLKS